MTWRLLSPFVLPFVLLFVLLLALAPTLVKGDPPRSGYVFQSDDVRALQDDSFSNPGMLWVDKGKQLFETPAGTTGESCHNCHKAGEIDAASFPAINTHTGNLVNLTTQVQHCREFHQGADALAYESTEALALTAYLANQQQGESVPAVDPTLTGFAERGKSYFDRRKGQLNLACGQCHDQNAGRMLRGDRLSEGHSNGYPIYRLEWQTLGSLHRRLRSCDIGVRAEPHAFGSEAYIELELYLKSRAQGLSIETPAVRR